MNESGSPAEPTRSCPSCGADNRATNKFCYECGARLAAATPQATTAPLAPEAAEAPVLPPATPPAPARPAPATRRWALIGCGCLLGAILLMGLSWATFRAVAGMLLPTPLPATRAAPTPTATPVAAADAAPARTAEARTAEALSAATAEAEDATAEALAAMETAAARPTRTPPPDPTATPVPEPTSPPVLTGFSEADAQTIRAFHDETVGAWQDLLLETFDQGQQTKARWEFGDAVSRQLVNNRYEISLLEPNAYNADYWRRRQGPLGDSYTAELTVRFPALEQMAMAGLTFDAQDNPDQAWLYVLTTTGEWRIYRDTLLFASGPIPVDFEMIPQADYSLWVLRLPDQTHFFFNGVPVAVAPGSAYPGGRVGVVAVSGPEESDVPYTAFVDTFLVKAP